MSGNFDYPSATAGRVMTAEEANNIIQDARSHRSVLRNSLEEMRRLGNHVADPNEQRRLMLQQTVQEEIRRPYTAGPGITSNTNGSTRPLQTMMRPRHGTIRHRPRPSPQGQEILNDTGGSVQMAVERLNEASSNLSSLLDQPIPRIGSPDLNTREYSGEAEMNRRRKRRKLDTEISTIGHLSGFSYGHFGQVISAPLRMELLSCDGGIHQKAARSGNEYCPQNVLRNDRSVYCTNESKCNILLRQIGETPFNLKKLVIKAPERGYTAPIQEGMVFVSMTTHDLLSGTAQYHMRNSSPQHHSDDANWPGFGDNTEENRPLSRRRNSSANRSIPPPISSSMSRTGERTSDTTHASMDIERSPLLNVRDEINYIHHRSYISENLGFRVETSCDDPSADEEEPSSAATLADLRSRDRLPQAYDPSTDEETEDSVERAMRRAGRSSVPLGHRRSRRRAAPSQIDVEAPLSTGTGDMNPAKLTEPLPPHAKFFVERDRSVVSIKFNPPVSGKFILLKLWSPARDQNIDIQSIVAHGFAGLRFFPALGMI